jgi:hypothetical protein
MIGKKKHLTKDVCTHVFPAPLAVAIESDLHPLQFCIAWHFFIPSIPTGWLLVGWLVGWLRFLRGLICLCLFPTCLLHPLGISSACVSPCPSKPFMSLYVSRVDGSKELVASLLRRVRLGVRVRVRLG